MKNSYFGEIKKIIKNYNSLHWSDRLVLQIELFNTPFSDLDAALSKVGRVLDLGCGYGLISYFLAYRYPSLQILGIDPSEKRIETARNFKNPPSNVLFSVGTIDSVEEKDFDSIFLIDVSYFLLESVLVDVLKKCYEKTKPGGTLIIKSMNKSFSCQTCFLFFRSYLNSAIAIVGNFFPPSLEKYFSKILGVRKNMPNYHYPGEMKKILEEIGWSAQVQDRVSRSFFFPHIIYLCKKNKDKF